MASKESRLINRMNKQQPHMVTPIATDMVLPNHSGDVKPPVNDGDLANKKYVDDNAGGAPEGTSVKSTGAAPNQVLTSTGADECVWQTPSGSGDMTKAVYDTDDSGVVDAAQVVTGSQASAIVTNTAKVGITPTQASNITTNNAKISYNSTASTKLGTIEESADVTDTTNVTAAGALMDSEVDSDIKTLSLPASTTISTFGASLIDDAAASNARTTLGLGTFAVLNTATDNSTADTAYPAIVLYNTDATPPTASTVPRGSIYIQYTA